MCTERSAPHLSNTLWIFRKKSRRGGQGGEGGGGELQEWTPPSQIWINALFSWLTGPPKDRQAKPTGVRTHRVYIKTRSDVCHIIIRLFCRSPTCRLGLTIPLCCQGSTQQQQPCLTDGDTDRLMVRTSQHPARLHVSMTGFQPPVTLSALFCLSADSNRLQASCHSSVTMSLHYHSSPMKYKLRVRVRTCSAQETFTRWTLEFRLSHRKNWTVYITYMIFVNCSLYYGWIIDYNHWIDVSWRFWK